MGECAWRLSGWVRVVGNVFSGSSMDLVQSKRGADRGSPAENRGREKSAAIGRGGATLCVGEHGESLWVDVVLAHLLLPVEPFSDGSHRRVSVAEFSRDRAAVFSRA